MRIPRFLARFRQFVFAVLVTAMGASPVFGDTFSYNGTPIESKFYVTTTSGVAGKTVKLYIKATGTFYIDWGDGNVTSHTTSSSSAAISHGYASGTCQNGCTVRFGWLNEPTAYPAGTGTTYTVSTISFYNAANDGLAKYISSVGGSLGELFPTLAGASSATGNAIFAYQPRFISTFQGSTNWTGTIPSGLFSGLSGPFSDNMFRQTFYQCSGLTGYIPDDLFGVLEVKSGTNTISNVMYRTFYGATSMAQTCPAGTYNSASYNAYGSNWKVSTSNTPTVVSCSLCPANTYNASTGATSSSACTACPTGTESPAGSDSATDCVLTCPAGTYEDQGSCESCPAGTYNPDTGSTSVSACLSCAAGTYNDQTGQSACTSCPSGYPNSLSGTDDIAECYTSGTQACASYNQCSYSHATCSYANTTASCKEYNDGTGVCVPDDPTDCDITDFTCDSGYEKNQAQTECVFSCPADATVNGTNNGCVCIDSVNYTWDSLTNTCIANVTCSVAHTTYNSTTQQCEPDTGYKWTDSTHTACELIKYRVEFYANGGSGTTADMNNLTYGTSYNLTANGFSRTGYEFDGWCLGTTTCATADYTDGELVSNLTAVDGATVTMYAKWEPIDYTITYNLDGGACSGGSCSPTSYNIESATITLPIPTKTGYMFGGWYDNSGLSGTAVTDIQHGSTGNVPLYAKWTPKTYSVSYTCDGSPATVDSQYQTATYGSSYSLASNTGVCGATGYTTSPFTCTNSTTGTTVSLPTNNWNIDSAVVCAATNQLDEYTVTYVTNDGTCSNNACDSVSYTVNSSTITLPTSSSISKTGNTFIGWYDNAALSGNAITSFTPDPNDLRDRTFYAKWTANTIILVWTDTDGYAITVPSSINCTYGGTFTTPAALTTADPDYDFKAWKIGNNSLAANWTYACDDTVLGTDNGTVYIDAVWKTNTCGAGYSSIELPSNAEFPRQGSPTTTYPKGRAYIDPDGNYCTATNNSQFTLNCNGLASNEFKVKFTAPSGGGMVYGTWLCDSNNAGASGANNAVAAEPNYVHGNNCYCRMDKYTLDGSSEVIPVYVWAHVRTYSSCDMMCASFCADGFAQYMGETSNLRTVLYNAAKEAHCVYDCPVGQTVNDTNNGCVSNTCPNNAHLDAATDTCVYFVNYDLDGGSLPIDVDNPTFYTKDTPTFNLPTPFKPGYTFAGWYDNSSFTGSVITSFTPDSNNLGDKTFYAKWIDCLTNASAVTGNANTHISGITATVVNNACVYTVTCAIGYNNENGNAWDANDRTYEYTAVAGSAAAANEFTSCAGNTVYLNWLPDNGSVDTAGAVSCTYGGSIGQIEEVSRTGYTFAGWTIETE